MEKIAVRFPDKNFWNNKRVLVTGHTGFKGAWLTQWLTQLGAKVCGVSLDPITDPDLWTEMNMDMQGFDFRVDIRSDAWQRRVDTFKPEIAFHLAAQPLVVTGWKDPKLTFDTNLGGMVQFLSWINTSSSLSAGVLVTSDKVYRLDGKKTARIESDPLGGADPYSASKAASELIAQTWPMNPDKKVATARSGNVIGGGDWAEDRLIPDLIRAWRSPEKFTARNPNSIRPWQHVLEPLSGYILMAEDLFQRKIKVDAINFGPIIKDQVSVSEVVKEVQNKLQPPNSLRIDESPQELKYEESEFLLLDSTLAESELGWRSVLNWKESIDMTLSWYSDFYNGIPALKLVQRDIELFGQISKSR
ncbi:unannotated protein [freshwater metagenome]|uniref:Unannotated protein n=1 Tax=freshwater metagenome TaxID=449393 RepID=A0A6J5Z2L1_9ZZZZ|nr:CDP-glucose 4,6-dehydratase [Actinomycetota bacterium]MSW25688.1 CDP-glucose 4,6-dehydratase [Actinomycetota bacterium]MSW33420.1 CDP-glucose 4,6-dehydratase [Actinomycetota bacterium]MSX30444.1 CDP-glucose 4,6-dehydratase [Actinomycetota bacterium]MSX51324.1 CDP-glucose 4,6-dehydratase [Actinomycetota bacterium]